MFSFHRFSRKLTVRGGCDHRPQAGMGDMVNRPAHYTVHPVFTGECHDYAKHMTFDQGNAFKYLWRCAAKGDMVENVRKALWYLNAMRTGPVLNRRGNRISQSGVDLLATEVSDAMDAVHRSVAPRRYMAALACYSAAVRVADGDVDDATAFARHALKLLNGVE